MKFLVFCFSSIFAVAAIANMTIEIKKASIESELKFKITQEKTQVKGKTKSRSIASVKEKSDTKLPLWFVASPL